ncbi:unnamed protein product (macronuclear) [Paramecium tetraurelia]|uniref:Uncharacterized protein n=1 Tax=Paramecium tetraurelia TaxID=5888 RepID=A0C4H2_PARTE|nr:uncharacterized protein GSPATT00035169001 [Paramecium tetraurelia]CAK65689.1 unnamed protein product [Paramecium tetraurelia]|eukprot:XP_001433086.1 hypothetical protein (macronuclear) [Paramecium tetraurelia strain d4-2]
MQQASTQDQFSFVSPPNQDNPTQITIFQSSAMQTSIFIFRFGQDTKETSIISVTKHTPLTPNQHLYNILEQFGSTLARCLALKMIGIQSYLKQSFEYLNHNIQDLKMLIFNAQVMYASKNQTKEFELARDEQCTQIQALINGIEDDSCKQALSNLLGKIEEVRFSSQYTLKIAELLETETIYFRVIEEDKSMKTFIDLIKKDSIIIAQQLCPYLIVLSAVFKEVLKLDMIHQTQQNSYSLEKFVNHLQQLNKDQDISSYCEIISKIYPRLKDHFTEIEEIRGKKRNYFQCQLADEDKDILNLFYDKQSIYVLQFPLDKVLPEEICELIQLTYFLITQGQKKVTQQNIETKIQKILQNEQFKQYSFIFDLIADCVHQSQLKLLFYGYVQCILDTRFIKFTSHLQTDLTTLNQLSQKPQAMLTEQQLQQLKDMLCITRRQNLQFQDFTQIINSAGQIETLVATKYQEALEEATIELENQLKESHEINELIINKEPAALQIRAKKLKSLMELFLRFYKVSNETLQKLFLYYEKVYEIKQQPSTIFQKQKVPVAKDYLSTVQNQKKTQNWIEIQNQILNDEVLGTEKNYYRPSVYKIFKGLTNQQTIPSSASLQKILRSFQAKYQNTYANQIQSDFVNLLKEIIQYSQDKQVITFETNFRKYYKKEFKEQLMELPQNQFESLTYALKVVQAIEDQQQQNN